MRLLTLSGLLLVSTLIAGCSTNPVAKTEKSEDQVDNLISQDLINVLVQVRSLNNERVALAVPDSTQISDEFGKALVANFKRAGYHLLNEVVDSQTLPVSYTVNQAIGAEIGAVYTYTVNVGNVSVRRTYRPLRDGWATPVSEAQIRGASAANLIINNDLFNRSNTPKKDDLVVQSAPVRTTIPNGFEETAAVTYPTVKHPPVKTVPAPSAIGVRTQPQQDNSGQFFSNSDASQKQNVRNLGESNFANILNAYGTVNEAVLIFPNDSTVLGSDNKETVSEFVGQFDSSRDIFSVIGCSHGPTAVSGGQEALALGRAQRVREALLFAGVPENSILDEGCWHHEQFDERMPRRGVVLALKRKV